MERTICDAEGCGNDAKVRVTVERLGWSNSQINDFCGDHLMLEVVVSMYESVRVKVVAA